MIQSVVDASIFGFATSADPADATERFHEWTRVIELLGRTQRWVKPVSIEQLEIRLAAIGQYPTYALIREALEASGMQGVYHPRDIAATAERLLRRTSPCDANSRALWERSEVVPDFSVRHVSHELAVLCEESLLCAALMWHFDPPAKKGPAVIGRVGAAERSIQVSGHAFDMSTGLNFDVDVAVPLAQAVAQFQECSDPLAIWRAATTVSELHLAISLAATRQLRPRRAMESAFCVGAGFLESISANEALDGRYTESVLSHCVDVVLARAVGNEFRENSRRTSAQLKRADGAGAWRVHISKGHEAMRLMYWRRTDGRAEFANVGNKNELEISAAPAKNAYPGADDGIFPWWEPSA